MRYTETPYPPDARMNFARLFALFSLAAALQFASPAPAPAQPKPVDATRSKITIYVYKSGLFSALGHNHEVAAPVAGGTIDDGEHPAVKLRVRSGALQVLDADLDAGKRAEVQKTMLGPEVLDVERYPQVFFASTSVEKAGAAAWSVRGTLTLHGRTQPLTMTVEQRNGVYRGSVEFKQSAFGIKPVSVGGGAVRVKDQVKIQFEIALSPP
jgi:polyisoprenoid-binding protein YceI